MKKPKTPKALDAMVAVVLAYKPKPKSKPSRKRQRTRRRLEKSHAENSAKWLFLILRHVPVITNFVLAIAFMFGAWCMAGNPMFVFPAGYLCAVFAEKGWYGIFPEGLHIKIWPRI
jgi:hypothetical protein